MRELTTDTLQEEVSKNELVFVQFSAGWCGNCRIMKPKFKKFSTEVEGAEFLVVDAENNPESRKLADVTNLPTFAVFKNGAFVSQVQTNKTDVLKSFIDEAASN
ncbi:thiol-disulfide isomerase/thioredoxin [Wenyingzhuangia heitensis]|uniref:Thiol-disulfide isomerase/thioredoxin n=1 Tax=Wenyingzhuangia heitensis TaxID=1487859 RepID=A0ABX0U944_9FLAO|nr:thioredoxin family protein [Wenyingzhuangia heitensis]NIJ45367.1 thiol-disulfide isomerase/thioredoxin [Wenyingzhuangia heitensis]